MNAFINTSNDYSIFKRLKGNRAVEPSRVNKIVSSIKEVGYITNPLIVNEEMEIVDGQGRFEALRQLGLPVDYIVVDGIGNKECISMNINQSNWKLIDYIKSYAEIGKTEYMNIEFLAQTFPSIPLKTILSIARNSVMGVKMENVTNGSFTFLMPFNEVLEELKELSSVSDVKYSGRNDVFFAALHFIYTRTDTNFKVFKNRLETNYQKLNPFSTVAECLKTLSEVFNFKLGSSNRVYWETDYRRIVSSRSKWKNK